MEDEELEEKIYKKMYDMCVTDLWEAGVDTSYFPDEAKEVVKETAKEITELVKGR